MEEVVNLSTVIDSTLDKLLSLAPAFENADMVDLAKAHPKLVKHFALPRPSLDGRTVLLAMGDENFYGLDEVGSDIWVHLEAQRSVPEIARCLSIEYAAPVERLEVDVRGFMADMRRRGLVVPTRRSA